jgi:hypothetical protein
MFISNDIVNRLDDLYMVIMNRWIWFTCYVFDRLELYFLSWYLNYNISNK